MFEKIIVHKLTPALKHTITEEQHGFVSGKSTVTNLALTNDIIFKNKEKSIQTDIAYTDFTKAFDRVSHAVLLAKLEKIGISGSLLQWLSSYLSGRTLSVSVRDSISDPRHVTSGVPQGSHLGPLLFNLFINDLVKVINSSKVLMFADDAKLIMSIRDESDCVRLQSDIDNLYEWCELNGVQINVAKCKVLRIAGGRTTLDYPYKVGDAPIKLCKEACDLGVTYSESGRFDIHIKNITTISYQLLGFINRTCRDFPDPSTFKALYNTIVRPKMEYATPIWTPHTDQEMKSLESVQNRFLRLFAYKQGQPMHWTDHDYDPIRTRFNISTLESRRKYNDALLLYKTWNGFIDCPDLLSKFRLRVPTRQLRSSDLFAVDRHRSNYYKYSIIERLSTLGNELNVSLDLFDPSLTRFERKTADYFFRN